MISTHENAAGATTLANLEKLAEKFAGDYNAVRSIVTEMENEMARIKAKHIAALRNVVARAQTSRAVLHSAVEAAPELFIKPKTQIFHGIKIGFTKGKGKLEIADEEWTVKRIEQLFGKDADNYLHTFKAPNKETLPTLPATELKKIGVTIIDAGDAVVIKPVDGEVDKIVSALLKPEKEVA